VFFQRFQHSTQRFNNQLQLDNLPATVCKKYTCSSLP